MMTARRHMHFPELGVAVLGFSVYLIFSVFVGRQEPKSVGANRKQREWSMTEAEARYKELFERAAAGDRGAVRQLVDAIPDLRDDTKEQSVFAALLKEAVDAEERRASETGFGSTPVSEILDEFISSFDRLLQHLAVKYRGFGDFEKDLVNAGRICIFKALRSYALSRGRFISFASLLACRGMIDELGIHTEWRARRGVAKLVRQVEQEWQQELGRTPDAEAIAKELGISVSRVLKARPPKKTVSIDDRIGGAEGTSIADRLADENADLPDEEADKRDLARLADVALHTLDSMRTNWGTMLRLTVYRGWSRQQIAELTGYTKLYIGTRVSYAKATMNCVKKKSQGEGPPTKYGLTFEAVVREWLTQCLARLNPA